MGIHDPKLPPGRSVEEVDAARRALKAFARAGYELFPMKMRAKIPRDEGWQHRQYTLAGDIASWVKRGGNVGVRLRDVDLVLDVDPRNFAAGDDPMRRLCQDVGVDLEDAPTVMTGRGDGGRHIYFRKPAGMRVAGKLEGYKGIDIRSKGTFVVAPGSIHPDTGGTYRVDPDAPAISDVREAPEALLALIAREDNTIRIGGEGAGIMTNEQMAVLLEALDPEKYSKGEYDRWFRLCAACHDATGGLGLAEFQHWCAGDAVYSDDAERVQAHWESCTAGKRGGAGYKHLLSEVSKAGRPDLVAAWESEDERDALLEALDDYDPDQRSLLDALKEDDHG